MPSLFQKFPILAIVTCLSLSQAVQAQPPSQAGPAEADTGSQRRPDYAPAAYAITHAKIVTAPGQVIEGGTIVVRDGVIEAVGPADEVTVPYDAEEIEGKGLVVYPGFIDLYTTEGQDADATRSATGKGRPIPLREFAQASTPPDNRNGLTPEFQVAEALAFPASTAEARRKLGITAVLSAPDGGIATGQSALVSMNGLNRRESVLAAPVALHITLASPRSRSTGLSDGLLDQLLGGSHDEHCAGHSHPIGVGHELDEWLMEATADSGPPDSGGFPGALMGVVAHLRQAMLDAEQDAKRQEFHQAKGGPRPPYDPSLEALHAAQSGKLPTWWQAETRDEIHRALDLAKEFGTSCVIVGGREAYKVTDRLKAEGVPVVLRINFPKKPEVPSEGEYRKKPVKDRDKPLRQLEQERKDWEERVACAKVLSEAGITFGLTTADLSRADTFHEQVRHLIDAGLPVDAALKALTTDAAKLTGVDNQLGTLAPGKLGHLVAWSAEYGEKDAKPKLLLVDGRKFEIDTAASSERGARGGRGGRPGSSNEDTESEKSEEKKPDAQEKDEKGEGNKKSDEPAEKPAEVEPFQDIATEFDEDRKPGVQTNGDILIKNVTIVTVTKGTIDKGSILVQDGKIKALGTDVDTPEGVLVIDGEGMVAAPGIIDTHSHMAISGGVNEATLSIVPEVRVKDVVTGDDISIYRAAAGGTTAARLLHGSANTIGGQDAVIKLHYGKPARDLLVKGGPQGIKFALGENVTQKNSSGRNRFPYTRMGVEAVLVRAFEEASDYQTRRKEYAEAVARGDAVAPFRRDLRLESLADILDGKIKIHSHSYRSDEILMLLRTAERYGIRVQSLQHVLEGYKLAPEIAAHGASCSTFSDWWAYKIEAYDAIPYNAALLTQAGVNVCIKSDSDEEVRHLNLEAAKMVRYGGLTEDQAMALVTINPARELGLDHRIGSLEVGKDADLALYNAHPLDGFAQCQLTLIDGEIVFQRYKGENGKVVLKPRDGEHQTMPMAGETQRSRSVEIPFNPDGTYALVNATLHPVSGPAIEAGTLIVSNGRIAAIGRGEEVQVPAEATSIDLGGLDVWPGMIDAGSTVGLVEIGSIGATQDSSELAPHQPELKASVAINPESAVIAVNRAAGVLSSFVRPTGGTISGQGCVIDLYGWVYPELVQKDEVALYINLPEAPPSNLQEVLESIPTQFASRFRERYEGREKRLDEIKDQFRQAKAYDKVVQAAKKQGQALPPPDPRMEALAPYANGEKPVVFRAEGRADILQAIEFAKDLGLKAILSGGGEAWKVADEIKKAEIPVIVQGTQRLPGSGFRSSSADPYDAAYANPAKLAEAGVTFAIASSSAEGDDPTVQRNLPFEAATAVGFGLSEDEALKAVTLYPAEILGVAESHGTLEPGKRANLVITAGHLLQPTTEVKHIFVGGRPMAPESRHTEFYERYSGRLAEVKEGTSPLGLDRKPAKVTEAGSGGNSTSTGGEGSR